MSQNNKRTAGGPASPSAMPVGDNLRAGLILLRQAYLYALDADADPWGFALEIDRLYEAGLTICDLRWLVAKGFALHAQETSVYGDRHRSFRPSDRFSFVNSSCVVLTSRGVTFAQNVAQGSAGSRQCSRSGGTEPIVEGETPAIRNGHRSDGDTIRLKPRWDSTRRELHLADTIVKRFRVPARNQETVLCVFEEEGWPEHIDDPLPLTGDIDPQTRLHDTINRLNRSQTHPLLRFRGNGHGSGVRWELRLPDPRRESVTQNRELQRGLASR